MALNTFSALTTIESAKVNSNFTLCLLKENLSVSGGVLFYDGTQNAAHDGTNFVWDNTTKSLKIGTGFGTTQVLGIKGAFTAATGGTATYGGLYITNNDTVAADKGGVLSLGGNYTGTTDTRFAAIAGLKDNATDGQYGGYMTFYTRTNGSAPAERMRIDSSGNVGIGASPTVRLHVQAASSANAIVSLITGTSTQYFLAAYTGSGSNFAGGLQAASSTTLSLITTSDKRMKENIVPLSGLDVINKLNPVHYRWIIDGYEQAGFLAQEVYEIIPEAVSKGDDNEKALLGDKGFKQWGMDNSKIIPYLTKAIKELSAQNATLIARIESLELKTNIKY